MKESIAIEIERLPFKHNFPEIINIAYDLTKLSIQVSFYQFNDEIINLEFSKVVGFRVLDEANLLEFWNEERPQGWVWEITENGWFDLERTRDGFTLGYLDDMKPREFLVLGIADCISVLTYNSPIISDVRNKVEPI